MEDESSSDIQKCLSDGPMETDEGPLINENSNGLSHLLTEGEFNSVEAAADESSASNQGFMNAVELSTGSVGDYLDNHSEGFNAGFDVGDNAVTFPSDSLNPALSEGDSLMSDREASKPVSDTDGDVTDKQKMDTDFEVSESETSCQLPSDDVQTNNDCITILDDNNDSSSLILIEKPEEKEPDQSATDISISILSSNDETKIELNQVESKEESLLNNSTDQPEAELKEASPDNSTEQPEIKTVNSSQEPLLTISLVDQSEEQLSEIHPEDATAEIQSDQAISKVELVQAPSDEHSEQAVPEVELKSPTKPQITVENENSDEKVSEPVNTSPEETKIEDVENDVDASRTIKMGGAEETEVVSEDELPEVQKPSVKDAENVSDDELPGPKPAELPADTEVVSEDELPSSKKETRKRKPDGEGDGYDPGSPTSESESSTKKQAVAKNGESKPIPAEKRSSTDEKPKKKVLPELDKYWKVVNDDPTDFTGWTYLLQYVDQESDVEAAREAYDAFLSHYPYCYGYWRKYADYEKRKGSKKKCLEVLERGLKAIPLSVDLWIHYLNHIKAIKTEEHVYIRSQYERAIEACGLEFRSDRLWESYIKWEAENGSALHVTNIYDRLLATPTLGYTTHFDNFQEHVMSEPVKGVVGPEELGALRSEVRDAAGAQPQLDLPPGEDEPQDHVASEEEAQAIKERVIAARRKVHKTTGEQVAARWTYEEGIKRPYFHVKPLERCQLKNWKAYLEWEKQHGTLKRALILHERCLIACALYEEFWMRLVKFLEERIETNPELVATQREVLERACSVHHLDKPELHLHWAQFEEAQGNPAKAAEILDRIEKTNPNLVQIQYRRVNIERRRGDFDKCSQLYEGYISAAKNKAIASALAVKYARFLFHVRRQPEAARKVLDEAIAKDPLNPRLYMQRLDLALHTPDTPYEVLDELVQSYEKQEGADVEVCASMAWRRRELAEELGGAEAARAAHSTARARAKHLRKRARKHDQPPPPSSSESSKKKETATATNATSNYYQTPAAAPQSYDQSYAQPYQPPWGYQQPPGPYHHPQHAWPQYPNYY